ncbi:MAG: hypothetical protein A3F72_20295 [Bacteroidetes bacterium RIFCSPLOWO2_12_FULL_35_15]|nr:MAG: hypothetical protein A3F72_20295 [Bacteroidetes bacterium RIFCSPLOWO2_12_FULL_35_15]
MKEDSSIIKEINLDASVVSLRSDGIIQIFMKPNLTMNKNDGKQIVDALANIGGGAKFPILFIAGSFTLANTEARQYAASEEANQYTLASAFVVNNIAQKLMGQAYVSFNHPITPTRILTSEEDAVTWLKTFL